jgi:four helix bundle protein
LPHAIRYDEAETTHPPLQNARFWDVFRWCAVCSREWVVAGARHFRELECWQLASELKRRLFELADFPVIKRDFRFREQLRDAAASAPRNIAEGFGRRTHREFAHFLDVARGSLMECQNHLQDAVDRNYLTPEGLVPLDSLARRACGAVASLQRYLRRSPD